MIKPTQNYKMSKADKIRISKIRDAHLCGFIKRTIINADLQQSRNKQVKTKRTLAAEE